MTSETVNYLTREDALRCMSLVSEINDDVNKLIIDAAYSRGPLDDDSRAALNVLINRVSSSLLELNQQLLDVAVPIHVHEEVAA